MPHVMSTLSIHLDAMARYLPKKDSSYDELVRTGTYLHQRSGKIIVPNAEFATDHSTNGTLVVGTWSAPTSIKTGNATKMPDALVDRYQLGPELLLKKDFDLMQEYLKSITDEEEQDDYESRCDRSGVTLIKLLHEECAKLRHTASTSLVENMTDRIQRGLDDASLTSFNSLRKDTTTINRALKDTANHRPPLSMANVFLDAVRDLGENISLRLDLQLATTNAAGNYKKIIDAIKVVLTDQQEKDKRTTARALRAGGDPRKGGPAANPAPGGAAPAKGPKKPKTRALVWTKELGACRHCKKDGHLNRDCPTLAKDAAAQPASQPVKQPAKPEGAVKLAAGETGSTAAAESDDAANIFLGGGSAECE